MRRAEGTEGTEAIQPRRLLPTEDADWCRWGEGVRELTRAI